MGREVAGIFVTLVLSSALATPYKRAQPGRAQNANSFVGENTNELATAILQEYVDLESNLAFSPLGYSALLALLAEGAHGSTRNQLTTALRLPENPEVTRDAYKTVLERLNEKDSVNHPDFRNYFYIYKNFSVEPDYKAILQQNYLTEVKVVDRLDDDDVKQEGELVEVQIAIDAPGQEMTPNKQEGDDVVAPVKLEDSILPEKTKETTVPAESQGGERMPEKEENPITSVESEEIMQVSEDDVITKSDKVGPLKIVFPIPFPEKLKLRKLYDEREASPSGEVMTMQEEMLGKDEDKKNKEQIEGIKDDRKETVKGDGNEPMEDDKMEAMKDDKMEGMKDDKTEAMKDDKTEAMKEDKMEGIKDDKMEAMKDDKTEAMKDDKIEGMKDDKIEAMKEDKTEAMKDDKMEAMKDDKMEGMKDDKLEAMKDDKMEAMKEDKMEGMKDDKMEAMKDDKMEAIKDDKMEAMKDDKMEGMKEDKMEGMKDDKMEAMKDDKMEAMKDDKMEGMKEDKMEGMKDDKMEAMKDDKMEGMKDDKMGAIKDDKMEAMKDDKMEGMKDDKMEAMKDENKENDKINVMSEGLRNEMMKDESKKEEKDKKSEVMMVEDQKVTPITEQKEARHFGLPRLSQGSLHLDDITTSLSSNNIVRKDAESEPVSQILVFNGMYFKGTWATPFVGQKKDSFYRSDSEKSTVTVMNTRGKFRVGNVAELDSMAIELPYKGDRYSLLLLLPNTRSGLSQLTADLAGYSLVNIQKHLQFQDVELRLPSFEIEAKTKPIEALNKLGVSNIFSKENADLTGISKDSGLFVKELVQMVTVKVDNSTSSYNHISGGNPSSRSGVFKLAVDHPFLYFVRDTEENLIIVAGKVTDPSSVPKEF